MSGVRSARKKPELSEMEERKSGALLISIDNFDPKGYQQISSPFSLKSMQMLGINPTSLRVKSVEEVRALIRDADPVQSEFSVRLYLKKAMDQFEGVSAKIKSIRELLKRGAKQRKQLLA